MPSWLLLLYKQCSCMKNSQISWLGSGETQTKHGLLLEVRGTFCVLCLTILSSVLAWLENSPHWRHLPSKNTSMIVRNTESQLVKWSSDNNQPTLCSFHALSTSLSSSLNRSLITISSVPSFLPYPPKYQTKKGPFSTPKGGPSSTHTLSLVFLFPDTYVDQSQVEGRFLYLVMGTVWPNWWDRKQLLYVSTVEGIVLLALSPPQHTVQYSRVPSGLLFNPNASNDAAVHFSVSYSFSLLCALRVWR